MTCGLVDSRELLRFVVRIDGPDGDRLGTGFFAAPGLVVTCAHVVEDRAAVSVVPADSRIDLGSRSWRVAARSDPPPPGWTSAFWPFPDLAVLRADGEVDHPVPLLSDRDPAGSHECHSWGYARREAGIDPVGSPASLGFEGVGGDGYLQFKAGQVAPGLSGAPVVCPARRAIVGVVAVTRDARSDLGGWAAPVSALRGGDGVPGRLAELGAQILAANRAAVVRWRREWNAVLPVSAGDAVDRPWDEFKKGPSTPPSELLRADFGVVPYMFRDAELDAAAAWCENADAATPMSVMHVTAYGGAGKTRFAVELCKRLEPHGWVAGFWRDGGDLARVPLPRLVVIDYAEEAQADSLRDFLDLLARRADSLAPVQVLLLARKRTRQASNVIDVVRAGAPARLLRVLGFAEDNPVADTPLTLDQRESLYREAVRRFTAAWCPSVIRPDGGRLRDGIDLSHDRYGLPLEVLFEALADALTWCEHGDSGAPAPSEDGRGGGLPAEHALGHEEKYWRLTAPPAHRDHAGVLRECAGLATLAGARDHAEAHALLSIPDSLASPDAAAARQELADWLASMYDGPGLLNPLRPDRLGEALVSRVLHDRGDGAREWLGRVLGLPSDGQAERCLDVLARLSAYDDASARIAAAAVSRAHIALTLRAEAQARGTPERPGRTALAGALQRLYTAGFCALMEQELADADPGNTVYRRDLSISYERLADLARDSGDPARARHLYERSLTIRQQLADADPGNTVYRRDLSISYERLADLAMRTGDGETAAQWLAKALDVRRRLTHDEPARLDLAEELAYTLYLSAAIGDPGAREEAERLLEPFELLGHMTLRATALLRWARGAG